MATEYDKASRFQVKQDPAGLFAWLFRHAATPLLFASWLDARRLALPVEGELTCDLVAALRPADQPTPTHVLILELKSESARGTLLQLQGYVYRLCAEPPAELAGIIPQVGGVILNLTGPPQPDRLTVVFPGLPACDWQFGVLQCTLREEDAAENLTDILAGRTTRWLLPWIPLMHGGGEPAIMEGWKQAAAAELEGQSRATLAAFALLFAELAGQGEAWKHALEGWNVRTSQLVEEWRAEARAEGLAEGRAEGLTVGQLEMARESLRIVLENKFGSLLPELVQRIEAITAVDRLKAALRQASNLDSLENLQL